MKLLSILFALGITAAGYAYYSGVVPAEWLNGVPTEWLQGARADAPKYVFAPVEEGDVTTTVVASGALAAVSTVLISTQVSGQIARILADFNDEVSKGAVIAEIDPTTFQNAVTQAEAALEIARATVAIQRQNLEKALADVDAAKSGLSSAKTATARAQIAVAEASRDVDRKKTLIRVGSVTEADSIKSQSALDTAMQQVSGADADATAKAAQLTGIEAMARANQAQVEHALAQVRERQAALEQARTELARTKIRSPTDGTIIGRSVEEGQTVSITNLQTPTLFTIAQNLSEMQINISVDEADIGKVNAGQPVAYTVDSFPGRVFRGQVKQVRKFAQPVQNVVTYTVVASAPNPDKILIPGMTANSRIIIEERKGVRKVLITALRFRPPGAARPDYPHVWTVDNDGVLRPFPVTVGLADGQSAELIGETPERVVVGAETTSAPTLTRRILGGM